MENALLSVAILACPVGMAAMMWFMAKGMRKGAPAASRPEDMSIDDLRQENRALGRELARLGGERGRDDAR